MSNNTNSKALNFLLKRKEEMQKSKVAKATPLTEYYPNEYGYYTMQNIYKLDFIVKNSDKLEDGLYQHINKDGKVKQHRIVDVDKYNASVVAYAELRELGVKNCVELLQYDDVIKLRRKIGEQYYTTTITEDGITDEPYNGLRELKQFITLS